MKNIDPSDADSEQCVRYLTRMALLFSSTFLFSCGEPPCDPVASLNTASKTDTFPRGFPGDLIAPSLGVPTDSGKAVQIASHVLQSTGGGPSFRVVLFVSVDGGFLISLVTSPSLVGGGGLLWVNTDGSVWVLRRYR